MKAKRITKAGREYRKTHGHMLNSGGNANEPRFKGGAHSRDTDYKRSNKRDEERRARRGDIFDEE